MDYRTPRLTVSLVGEAPIYERKPAMSNDESTPTVPESEPSAEPTQQMHQEPVPEPEQPEQPVEVAEEKSQDQTA